MYLDFSKLSDIGQHVVLICNDRNVVQMESGGWCITE